MKLFDAEYYLRKIQIVHFELPVGAKPSWEQGNKCKHDCDPDTIKIF